MVCCWEKWLGGWLKPQRLASHLLSDTPAQGSSPPGLLVPVVKMNEIVYLEIHKGPERRAGHQTGADFLGQLGFHCSHLDCALGSILSGQSPGQGQKYQGELESHLSASH